MIGLKQIPTITIAVLAHNEAERIEKCLASLPLGQPDIAIHVIVNGSTDDTAELAQQAADVYDNVIVHDWRQGGKSRSWNRWVFDELGDFSPTHIFVDGDAEVEAGSVTALDRAMHAFPDVNAVSGMPLNGRSVEHYRDLMLREHGLFGDLYALSGDFLSRMKSRQIRLPNDLVGDDGLLAAMAKTSLENEGFWSDDRVFICEQAGFRCAPFHILDFSSWVTQYQRMISYSRRNFQNRIIKDIMCSTGPVGLPGRLVPRYGPYRDQFELRGGITGFFDRLAKGRMMKEYVEKPKHCPSNDHFVSTSI
ncbi:MAG: glycosyltransferase [Parasphingorhabdus sp.]